MNITSSAMVIGVADAAASSRFFNAHLGFHEVIVRTGFVALGREDAAVDIYLMEDRPRANVTVSFAVTGIAAEHARLRREGANITAPLRQEPWGEWVLQLTDPNGVVVQLVEWLPPAAFPVKDPR
ncbi:VOC family protein [Streptosporangium lutulentum]|uniref:Glyoxalase superfamily protein PhnB n=1 Tax=Streptosporangium lutulentum TaxID=1461250 RepID=A0ABT9QKY8_9ACTN|nr:VOC family protein [Streptosporangium lutulentum]MDP9847423.1 putative glyoxalase superfamily protein PhnB [Streptosporangium lutulentum]